MERAGGKGTTALLVGPAAAFFLLLLVLPLAVVVIFSFGERGPAGGYSPAFTFDNYLSLAARGQAGACHHLGDALGLVVARRTDEGLELAVLVREIFRAHVAAAAPGFVADAEVAAQ